MSESLSRSASATPAPLLSKVRGCGPPTVTWGRRWRTKRPVQVPPCPSGTSRTLIAEATPAGSASRLPAANSSTDAGASIAATPRPAGNVHGQRANDIS